MDWVGPRLPLLARFLVRTFDMLGLFRLVALIEGATTIVLFFVAMPLKYLAGNPALVPSVGMAHGIAFIAYLVAMVPALALRRAAYMLV